MSKETDNHNLATENMTSGAGGYFGDIFGTAEMRKVFDDAGLIQSWLDVEGALALAQAKLGLIPSHAAEIIAQNCDARLFDPVALRHKRELTDHPLVPVVWALADRCPEDVGGYVHWGATTQDIMDTGVVLQIAQALDVLERRLWQLADAAVLHVENHRNTVMAGRTHGQHAVPITFGLKAASWLYEALTSLQRLEALRERVLIVQFAGAGGTLASLAPKGRSVRTELAKQLSLGLRPISWHTSRDGFAELAAWVGLTAGLCERIAKEVIALQRTEIAELEEAQPQGKIGSSTMPQKRNPMTSEGIIAAARMARAMIAPAFEILSGEHERDMSTWESEWDLIPRLFERADGALKRTVWLVDTLNVHAETMRENLFRTSGLIFAESIMMSLAPIIGRQRAHNLVHGIATTAAEENLPFDQLLAENSQIMEALGSEGLRKALDPSSYLGEAVNDANAVLADYRCIQQELRTSRKD